MATGKKLSLVEKCNQLQAYEKVSLFSYIGSVSGTHTLTTTKRGSEPITLQGETFKRIGMTDADIVNEGIRWARENVGPEVTLEYSNSKQLPIVEKGINTVPASINEAVKQYSHEKQRFKSLLG